MTIKDQLIHKGYYIGKIKELTDNPSKFQDIIKKIKYSFEMNPDAWQYRQSILGREDLGFQISLQDIPKRRKLINEQNLQVTQQWYELLRCGGDEYILNYFHEMVYSFLAKSYPEVLENKENIIFNDSITLYLNGDHIDKHRDGANPGRICAFLIYLTDPLEYNDGGGHLILQTPESEKLDIVEPVRGNYAVLDFTQNNIFHTVAPVKNDFKRYCYIAFVTEKDKVNYD